MNQKEITRAALLMAAQGDPKKAAEMEAYLAADPQQQYPAGGIVVDTGPVQIDTSKLRSLLRSTVLKQVALDGIYLVFEGGEFDLYKPGQVTEAQKQNCIGVAVKLGGKSICVSLYDRANGEEITLTAGKDTTGWDGYKDNTLDAGADWDGKGNTEHLKAVGLNPEITLVDGQFIPSVAQWRFICLFCKELNQALAELGGDELSGWYWTSTEYSATTAWNLGLSNGLMLGGTKASDRYRVRAVSAFIG